MAQKVGVIDVHAEYGVAHLTEEYELLKKVTHWTKEDVARESNLNKADVTPSFVLKESFSELADLFDYVAFSRPSKCDVSYDNIINIWKKVIETQKHFNDIALKIRSLAITILGLAIGAYGLKDLKTIDLSTIYIVSGALSVAWMAFFVMDRYHYHPLLIGAVKHAESIEDRYSNALPDLSLTKAISTESPTKAFWFKIHSTYKISIFYGMGLLIIAAPWINVIYQNNIKNSLINIVAKFL